MTFLLVLSELVQKEVVKLQLKQGVTLALVPNVSCTHW